MKPVWKNKLSKLATNLLVGSLITLTIIMLIGCFLRALDFSFWIQNL